MAFFSVLIPVYNVERYLDKCIKSVLNQSFGDFELILSDDGSTDKSGEICDKYSGADPRIRVIHKDNEGLLQTRRGLLKLAAGNYVIFLDSDDFWEKDLLKEVFSAIDSTGADLVMFEYNIVSDGGKLIKTEKPVFENYTVFEGGSDRKKIFNSLFESNRLNHMWAKVIKKDIVDIDTDYSRYKDVKGEDIVQSLPIFEAFNKMVYISNPLYNYRLSVSGRTRNMTEKYFRDFHITKGLLYNYASSPEYAPDGETLFFTGYFNNLLNLLYSYVSGNSRSDSRKLIENIMQEELFKKGAEKLPQLTIPKNSRRMLRLIMGNHINLFISAVKLFFILKEKTK